MRIGLRLLVLALSCAACGEDIQPTAPIPTPTVQPPQDDGTWIPPRIDAAQVLVTAASARLRVAGEDPDQTDVLMRVIDARGRALARAGVQVSAQGGTVSPTWLRTNSEGEAVITFRAGTKPGDATINATVDHVTGSTMVTVEAGAPVTLVASLPVPTRIGVIGAPFTESTIEFRLQDRYGNDTTGALSVQFSASNPAMSGEVRIAPASSWVTAAASVKLSSSRKSGATGVAATVTAQAVTTVSAPVFIEGDVPSASNYQLAASKRVLSGLLVTGLETTIDVFAADRFGNPVPMGTPISMMTESGSFGSNPVTTDATGRATAVLLSGDPLDVFPHGPAAKLSFPLVGTLHDYPALGHPANGHVAVIAVAEGQSGFLDLNGNGVFDAGLDVVVDDPSEAYLDIDESGGYELGEPFFDNNGNDLWDSHEIAAYHHRQQVWDQTSLVYTGDPAIQLVPAQFIDMNANGAFDRENDLISVGGPAAYPLPFPSPATFTSFQGPAYVTTYTSAFVSFMDENGNQLPVGSRMSGSIFPENVSFTTWQPNLEYQAEGHLGRIVEFVLINENSPSSTPEAFVFCISVNVSDVDMQWESCFSGIAF